MKTWVTGFNTGLAAQADASNQRLGQSDTVIHDLEQTNNKTVAWRITITCAEEPKVDRHWP